MRKYNDLLPIALLTYIRLGHLKKTVEALQKNTLASQSELFIISDGPQKEDEKLVTKVKKYVYKIKGFKKIHIIEHKDNNYPNNLIKSINFIMKEYGAVITLEDDIVTAPGFLQFMNDAEKYYRNNKKVFSISGYTPPIKISNEYTKDYFSLRRFSGWGNVIWADKYFEMNPFTKEQFQKGDKQEIAKYGLDLLTMMEKQANGSLNANDVNIMFHQYQNDMYTVYPKKSLVQNIGHDGSGVHCGVSNKFHHDTLWDKTEGFVFDDDIIPNQEIVKANFDFRFEMNDFSKEKIINDLVKQIEKLENNSFSVYGIGEITTLLLAKLYIKKCTKRVNYFIDSRAETQAMTFNGETVISAKEALKNGERNFVIVSWNHKEVIRNNLFKLCSGFSIKAMETTIL